MHEEPYEFSEEELALKAALDAMEVPEPIPVEGWTCTVPFDRGLFEIRKNATGQTGWELTDEGRDWCDENMRHPYWVLGECIYNLPYGRDRKFEVFFTNENDYIHFKMMFG